MRRVFRKADDTQGIRTMLTHRKSPWPGREMTASAQHQTVDEPRRHADHLLLARFAPPALIINDKLQVLQVRGVRSPSYSRFPARQSPISSGCFGRA